MEPSAEFLVRSNSGVPKPQVTPQPSTSSPPMEKELALEETANPTRLEVARGKKIPEMTSWVAEQLKLACDTEQKMSARIEALEAALHAKGGHVTDTEEESALHHLQAKMQDAHSKLDSLLGVSSSPE
ncbi:hypothetical protein R1sor_018184 [Riccia sorocarpa]|uniref:Uncharacterized protein n=1 Tax=Riccia sorocarpa TaxID=122646 RepID=A0ABD3IBQ3_9MARC